MLHESVSLVFHDARIEDIYAKWTDPSMFLQVYCKFEFNWCQLLTARGNVSFFMYLQFAELFLK